jgi:tRNA-specific 2-thiouridylase
MHMQKRVFVGLSGGVDSSVSAALLQKAGYAVTGVFIRVWQPDFFSCSWKDDRLDAMRVCARLGIPFRELNLEKEYKSEVVDYMLWEYKAGRTPNPDVACNRSIKFGAFYQWARAQGADFVATGHYARIERGRLLASADTDKDQSYFLWQIRKEQLSHILFPVGGMRKGEVRKLAKRFGLATADKKDSQGLCFVGKVDMKEFLSRYIKQKKGNIVDEQGKIQGEHEGAALYTIGERVVGRYVVAKDMKKNTLIVAEKNPIGVLPRAVCEVEFSACNWFVVPRVSTMYLARTRYRQPLQEGRIRKSEGGKMNFIFAYPQSVASGQSIVIYEDARVVGGGIIV